MQGEEELLTIPNRLYWYAESYYYLGRLSTCHLARYCFCKPPTAHRLFNNKHAYVVRYTHFTLDT